MSWRRSAPLITRTVRRVWKITAVIEVETSVLQLVTVARLLARSGTHLNAFDQPMTMRIVTELPPRAVVGGIDCVRDWLLFRNEGVDSTHSPEFTTLECYETYATSL